VSSSERSDAGRLLRVAIQIVGIAAGVASLWWCISQALSAKNREQLQHLAEAPRSLILALAGLSLATLITNGLIFWTALCPVRRLRIPDMLAANALCTFLGYVPLKAGALMRVIIHNRRDHVPVPTIGAWFVALLVEIVVAFVPAVGATIWLGRIDGRWAALTIGGIAVLGGLVVLVARRFRGPEGLERWSAIFRPIPAIRRLTTTRFWSQLHAGFDMLASPWAVFGVAALRVIDLSTFAARFLVAAAILDVPLSPAQAIPVALAYFLIGVVSPSGLAGLREGGVALLFGSLFAAAGMSTADANRQFAGLALLVTAIEAIAFLAGGAIGLAWLRPDRLLRPRDAGITAPPQP
jgi:hypothetical protein